MRKTIKHNISFDINIKPRVDTHIPEREQCSQIDDREREKKERKIKRNYGGKNQNLDGIE